MLARIRPVAIGFTSWLAIALPAICEPTKDVPVPLKQAGQCMLKVLEAEPGVDHARLGVTTDDGWTHIFLEYEASEKTRWQQPTRFDVQKPADPDRGPYMFTAVLPGIVGPEGFDFHVTKRVIKNWRERCGVSALILTA